jgi:hypothetical protein
MTSDGVKAFHLVTIKRQNQNWRIAWRKMENALRTYGVREIVTVLPFRHLPGTSAFKPLPTWYATGAERIGSE